VKRMYIINSNVIWTIIFKIGGIVPIEMYIVLNYEQLFFDRRYFIVHRKTYFKLFTRTCYIVSPSVQIGELPF